MAALRDYGPLVRVLLLTLLATTASAHDRNESFSRWQVSTEGVEGSLIMPLRLAERLRPELPAAHSLEARVLEGSRRLAWEGCPDTRSVQRGADRIVVRVRADCAPTVLRNEGLFAVGHLHLARVSAKDDLQVHSFDGPGRFSITQPTPPTLGAYLRLGLAHVLAGPDHLAFLLALLLVATTWRGLLAMVTGFTLGHLATLSAATLGQLFVQGPVEALIGFTIAFVAGEAVATRHARLPQYSLAVLAALALSALLQSMASVAGPARAHPALLGLGLFTLAYLRLQDRFEARRALHLMALALLFGGLHGLGFASGLQSSGLPPEALPRALLGFALGLELAQLGFALLGALLLRALPVARLALPAPLMALGLFWWASRL